jgi:CubicO group peptidase (beta-lactamase class C family)
MQYEIHGTTTEAFANLRSVFYDQFASHGEIGASVCMWHRGKRVVDLWGGYQDLEAKIPWQANTMTTIFSCTKGLVASCFLLLVDRREIKYDDLVSKYWTTFAQHDPQKEKITIRMLLNHRSGLLGFREPLIWEDLQDDEIIRERLEKEPLAWPADSQQGYHGVTFGLYTKILFQAIRQESIGKFLAREIATPLKADVYLGVPNHLLKRCAPIFPNQLFDILTGVVPQLVRNTREGNFFRAILSGKPTKLAFGEPSYLGGKALHNYNRNEVKQMQFPWANAQASARGLAQVYQALITENKLINKSTLTPVKTRQSWSDLDHVIRKPMGFTLGFVKEETCLFSPNQSSFGHPGAGGALGWADPDAELVIAYVMNRMGYHVRSPRALNLCHAAYQAIGLR